MQWFFSLFCDLFVVVGLLLLLLLWCISIKDYGVLLREDREFIWTLLIRMLINFIVYLAIIVPITVLLVFNFLFLKEILRRKMMFSLFYRALLCDAIWTMKALLKFIAIALSKVTFFVCGSLNNNWGWPTVTCLHLTKVRWMLKAWLRRPDHLRCTHINEVI